jgi:HK97 family phage major capsid protein
MDPETRLGEIGARLAEIDQQYHGRRFPDAIRDEWNALNAERADLVELAVRRQRLADLAGNPQASEQVDHRAPGQVRRASPWASAPPNPWENPAALRDRGLAVVDYYNARGVLNAEAADRADHVLRHADEGGDTAAYLHAVGNPDYATAFAKMCADPIMGHNRFSAAEVDAVRRVSQVQQLQRPRAAMSELTGAAGAFAIPVELDPSIILTSAGALNPVRELATVETIGVREWEGVSSDGVTAGYVGEATEATDASPTLAQPVIRTHQGRAFIRASIELFADWGRIRAEMARLVDDARQVVDATEFLTGTGNNRPVGILAVGTTGSLSTSQRVLSAATNSFAVGDPWLLKAAVPARFQANASVAASTNILDKTYRFVGGGSTEPPIMPTRDGAVMGLPKGEWSAMTAFETTGSRVMIAGDFRAAYRIIDRLGMTAELIPHIFGVTNNLPTGERGLYCYWRTGAAVVAPNALRYLEIK